MPRIRVYNTIDKTGDNDPEDFCSRCWKQAKYQATHNLYAEITEGDHPPYNDTDYKCHKCNRVLTDIDD